MACARESRRRRHKQIRRDFGHQRGWSVMRTVHFRSLSIAALALVTFAVTIAAQEQQLVKRPEPGDTARLAAHFTALADRYTAEANRHTAMGKASIGNPSRSLGTSIGAHCNRLAVLETQSATAVRELATYHQKL